MQMPVGQSSHNAKADARFTVADKVEQERFNGTVLLRTPRKTLVYSREKAYRILVCIYTLTFTGTKFTQQFYHSILPEHYCQRKWCPTKRISRIYVNLSGLD